MRKVVINNCFGGFGLSNKAVKMYAKELGKDLFFYKQTKYSFNSEDEKDGYTKVNEDDEKNSLFTFPLTEDLGEIINTYPEDSYFSTYEIEKDRSNFILIQIIEELGKEANGRCASLKIIEIPDDVEYEIDDYDGMESVSEVHRSWN